MQTLTPRRSLPVLLLTGGILLAPLQAPVCRAAAPTVEVIARLGGDPNGYHPQGALAAGADGNFYGTTEAGGTANCGTIYKITPGGTLTTLHTFTGKADGANPFGALVRGTDGSFYGTTSSGGNNRNGTAFKVTAAGALTTMHTFSAFSPATTTQNADGANAQAGLTQGSDGNFYGTTYFGGAKGGGVVFKLTPAGAVTALTSFDPELGLPATGLVEGGAGVFYSTLPYAGSNFSGLVYKITSAGVVTTLHTFAGGAGGSVPEATLTKGSDGNFYGTTATGGTGQAGTAFRITPAGVLTTLHSFNASTEGQSLDEPLVLGTDGNFYGVTARNGPTGFGAVYRMTPAGAVTVLVGIPGPGDGTAHANGLLRSGDGNFYGTVQLTGAANAGTIFKVTPAGVLTTLHGFSAGGSQSVARLAQYSDGNLYGTTQRGGALNGGTIFAATTAGEIETVHDFDPDTEGAAPQTGLLPDGSGGYYGTTALDGPNGGGSVFYLAPTAARSLLAPDSFQHQKFDFEVTDELESPLRGINDIPIIFVAKRSLVWMDAFGGADGRGSLTQDTLPAPSSPGAARAETAATGETVIYSFTGGADGGRPVGGPVMDAAGNYYGVTYSGGAHNQGTVCKITPAGVLTTLHSFAGTGDGALPDGGLARGTDGNFYGTTSAASYNTSTTTATGKGTIFKITPGGTFTTLHTLASDGSEGSDPKAALFQASDGKLYGTTSGGTVFSITTGGTFATLHTFGGTVSGDGLYPAAPLIEASDGNLYGTTQLGGTDSGGTIYKVVLKVPAPVITSATSATAAVGKAFSYQITATNSPASYGESGIPAGLSINQSTGKISGTPTKAGTYSVTIAAFNSGGSGSAKLTLTVKAAPVITSATTATATVGSAFSYQITATNSPTSYGESGIPAGLSINQTTGKISGTPTKAGTYSVTIAAFNSTGSGSAKLTLTVKAAVARPVITSSLNPPSRQGVAFSYQITATNSPTSYGESGIPAGLTINQTTGKISGTPTKAGTYKVTIAAFNSGGSGTATLTLVVKPPA